MASAHEHKSSAVDIAGYKLFETPESKTAAQSPEISSAADGMDG